jgi:integrase
VAFGNLAPDTQRQRRRILEHFRQGYGHLIFRDLQRKHVEAMLAKKIAAPHAARNFLKALRGLMATAIPAGLRDDAPTLGIRNVKVRATGGFRTWTEEEIAQFEVAHPVGSRARLAFGLLLYTAQRRGDVIRMGREDIQDGFIRVLATPAGLEPATCRLEGGCSIQLSYGVGCGIAQAVTFS